MKVFCSPHVGRPPLCLQNQRALSREEGEADETQLGLSMLPPSPPQTGSSCNLVFCFQNFQEGLIWGPQGWLLEGVKAFLLQNLMDLGRLLRHLNLLLILLSFPFYPQNLLYLPRVSLCPRLCFGGHG